MSEFTLSAFTPNDHKGYTASHKKENNFTCSYTLIYHDNEPKNENYRFNTVIEVRFYWTTGGTCYCAIWVNHNGVHCSATAKAGGNGYHKESHAAHHAMLYMGAIFTQPDGKTAHWGGSGNDATQRAMFLIAQHVNPKINQKNSFIHYAHG